VAVVSCLAVVDLATYGTVAHGRAALATLLVLICAAPAYVYLASGDHRVPLLPMIGCVYAAYFAVPQLLPFAVAPRFLGVPSGDMAEALWLSVLGVSTMMAAYYLVPAKATRSLVWPIPHPGPPAGLARAGTAVLLVGLAAEWTRLDAALPSSLTGDAQLFPCLALAGLATLVQLQLSGLMSRRAALSLWLVAVPAQFALDATSGFLYGAFRDAFVLGAVYVMYRRKVPWGGVMVACLLGFILLGAKGQYRSEIWTPNSQLSVPARAQIYTGLAAENAARLLNGRADYQTAQTITGRLNLTQLLAQTIALTPRYVPYWLGSTYDDLLTKLVPRAIWPDKPTESLGQRFGHVYGVLDPGDLRTSVNLPQMVELYINFGVIGIIFGMALLGVAYRLLSDSFGDARGNAWAVTVSVVLTGGALAIDSNFSLVAGGVLYDAVVLFLIGRLAFFPVSTTRSLRPVTAVGGSARARRLTARDGPPRSRG